MIVADTEMQLFSEQSGYQKKKKKPSYLISRMQILLKQAEHSLLKSAPWQAFWFISMLMWLEFMISGWVSLSITLKRKYER